MDKLVYAVAACALLACAVTLTFNAQQNPMDDQREWLASALDSVDESTTDMGRVQYDYPKWQTAINQNNYLWQGLIGPPKPDPRLEEQRKKAEALRKAQLEKARIPDVEKKLQGVSITRARVGSKARVVLPEYPRGVFLGPGDPVINGCEVLEVTPTSVKFGFYWEEEKRFIEHVMTSD